MINWPVFIIAVMFWISETRYFGWNMHPSSDAEMICDGIFFLIAALALLKK